MADNARGIHVSAGIYSREIDLTYAAKSLGITTLGVVGETTKGPAFQAMDISNWREFQDVFGGTSTEKYKGSLYPKYELPYIAKSYLSESQQLKVVRVLGLSGYNAGPAWIITASDGSNNKQAVAVIRSRGSYKAYVTGSTDSCICDSKKYDTLTYMVGEIAAESSKDCFNKQYNLDALKIGEYRSLNGSGDACSGYTISGNPDGFDVSQTNKGRFRLYGWTGKHESGSTIEESDPTYFEYAVSLNPYDKEYILNVLGTKAYDGDAPIYVESLYDVALEQGIVEGDIIKIDNELQGYQVCYTADYCHHDPISGLMTIPQSSLTRRYVGSRYLADKNSFDEAIRVTPYDYKLGRPLTVKEAKTSGETVVNKAPSDVAEEDLEAWSATTIAETAAVVGQIYTVRQYTDQNGRRSYLYAYYTTESLKDIKHQDMVNLYGNLSPSKKTSGNTENGQATPPSVNQGENASGNTDSSSNKGENASGNTEGGQATASSRKKGKNATSNTEDGQATDSSSNKGENASGNTDSSSNKGENASGNTEGGQATASSRNQGKNATLVYNSRDGLYYRMNDSDTDVVYVQLDMNDYKSPYRYASTPWIVSNLKGDMKHVDVTKLFRFHTISDGDSSNYEVKVSIENIKPDEGTFDVVVRRIDDADESIIVLERFGKCSMVPGDSNYIAYRIGSFDGTYEVKSKYITVEVNESTASKTSVPCGFLGYPIPKYDGTPIEGKGNTGVSFPTIKYNTMYDEDVKNRKQYFGLSSWVGVDIDTFTFKGTKAYIDNPKFLSHGFHLDSRLDSKNGGISSITVDNESGYEFDCVNTNSRTNTLSEAPIIGTEDEMYGSIYENTNLRKFTVFFYGGFDGWDVYRDKRTNTDEYKMSKYKGYINLGSGDGYSFNKIKDPSALKLNENGITSDWYAYLSGIRQFANPEETDINVFATPGIDYVNQKLLVEEAIEMIEEERADSIYVITTPDKPSGASDMVDDMYNAEEAVYNLEDTEIDSNYACTYYPWVKYEDVDNNQYIYLPPTKDAVRNFAQTDNTSYSWFAPAGINRGSVDCVRAHFITKLADEDTLYEGRINPVKTFAQDGVKIWGQKNLQINESQLNRISVRRLLLRIRKLIAISCLGLIFEPNDATVKQSFLTTVTPILDNVRSNRGVSDYRIEVNDTVESRERRELPCKIYIKPINALEYITIDFIVTPEGVSFDDI